jgi:hypothetical protein
MKRLEPMRLTPSQSSDGPLHAHCRSGRRRRRGFTPLSRHGLGVAVVAFVVIALAGTFSAGTAAAASSPWWQLLITPQPSTFAASGTGIIEVRAENLGDASLDGPATLTASLPPGAAVEGISFYAYHLAKGNLDLGPSGPLAGQELCHLTASTVSCTTPTTLSPIAPYEYIELRIHVALESGVVPGSQIHAEVSGGQATPVVVERPLHLGADAPAFEAEHFGIAPEGSGGEPALSAGSHPFQLTTTFALNQNSDPTRPPGLPRDLDFQLPPGLIGNATALPRCQESLFFAIVEGGTNSCPESSALGAAVITFDEPGSLGGVRTFPVPLFNLPPAKGEPARFGFVFVHSAIVLDTAVRSGSDYGITVSTRNITQLTNFMAATVTFWGAPGAPAHNESRGWGCLASGTWASSSGATCALPTALNPPAFLTLPTSCTTAFGASVDGLSWPDQGNPAGLSFPSLNFTLLSPSGQPIGLSGCNQLSFDPLLAARPTVTSASAPSGLDFDLDFNDEGLLNGEGQAQSQVKRVTVVLPRGITTNPSVANGLMACSLPQYNEENLENGAGCPESSKIGEVEIESPLVEPTIDGSIYVARQGENPAHNLLSIYMVAKNPELGVLIRSAGAVTPDQQTGQLSTTFDELPQLPFSHFHLSFRSGSRAPLITPGLCGKYTTQADLYPYSDPGVPVHREASFEVQAGANGRPCVSGEAQLPNTPTLEAGTVSPLAGAYSPLVFKVSREDGSQILSSISTTLPEGLLGKLAGIKECSNAQIAQAESRGGEGQGALELAQPSCPASSEVGAVNVGTGVGPLPYYVQGKAYLAGPYKGAALSLAIITPAVVGPFDLGTIVVRTALYVNEATAQITAKSDPIPTIVHGLPTVVQSISLDMNRPNFILNPTSCDPMQIAGSATSTLGNVAPLSQRFQVGACGALGFKPDLKLAYSGQTKRTGHPALKSVITYPKGDYANIARASVTLPKGVLIAQAHVNNPCTRVQFNSTPVPGEACPKKSVLGTAKVWTPLLEAPESGKIYFRSNGGERELPDLVIALRGQIPVTLVGFIDSVGKKGAEVRRVRTRFQSVPDAPVSRFELKLYGGKRGLLESSQNLCKGSPPATVALTAQNGKIYDTEPTVTTACGKKHKKSKKGGGKEK